MDVSVVIPSYNGQATIRRCMDSLGEQSVPPAEIIVVDSSSDETPEIVARDYPEVRLIHREERTYVGAARNIGVRAARTPYVAVTDTDCVAASRWIEYYERTFERTDCHAAVGSVDGPDGEHWVAAFDRLQFSEYLPASPRRETVIGPGCNFCVRRESYLEVGGCPDLPRSQDVVLFREMSRAFGPLVFEPDARVVHLSSDSLDELYRRQCQSGRGFAMSRHHDPSLPGASALHHRWLTPALPVVKATRVLARLALYDRSYLWTVLSHLSTYMRCLWFWTEGFREESDRFNSKR